MLFLNLKNNPKNILFLVKMNKVNIQSVLQVLDN